MVMVWPIISFETCTVQSCAQTYGNYGVIEPDDSEFQFDVTGGTTTLIKKDELFNSISSDCKTKRLICNAVITSEIQYNGDGITADFETQPAQGLGIYSNSETSTSLRIDFNQITYSYYQQLSISFVCYNSDADDRQASIVSQPITVTVCFWGIPSFTVDISSLSQTISPSSNPLVLFSQYSDYLSYHQNCQIVAYPVQTGSTTWPAQYSGNTNSGSIQFDISSDWELTMQIRVCTDSSETYCAYSSSFTIKVQSCNQALADATNLILPSNFLSLASTYQIDKAVPSTNFFDPITIDSSFCSITNVQIYADQQLNAHTQLTLQYDSSSSSNQIYLSNTNDYTVEQTYTWYMYVNVGGFSNKLVSIGDSSQFSLQCQLDCSSYLVDSMTWINFVSTQQKTGSVKRVRMSNQITSSDPTLCPVSSYDYTVLTGDSSNFDADQNNVMSIKIDNVHTSTFTIQGCIATQTATSCLTTQTFSITIEACGSYLSFTPWSDQSIQTQELSLSTSPVEIQTSGTNYFSSSDSSGNCQITSYEIVPVSISGSLDQLILDSASGQLSVSTDSLYENQFQIKACANDFTDDDNCVSSSDITIKTIITNCKDWIQLENQSSFQDYAEIITLQSTGSTQELKSQDSYASTNQTECQITSFNLQEYSQQSEQQSASVSLDATTGVITVNTDLEYVATFKILVCSRQQSSGDDCVLSEQFTVQVAVVGGCGQWISFLEWSPEVQNPLFVDTSSQLKTIQSSGTNYCYSQNSACAITNYFKVQDSGSTDQIQIEETTGKLEAKTDKAYEEKFQLQCCAKGKTTGDDCASSSQQVITVQNPLVEFQGIKVQNASQKIDESLPSFEFEPECPGITLSDDGNAGTDYICQLPNIILSENATSFQLSAINGTSEAVSLLSNERKIHVDPSLLSDHQQTEIVLTVEITDDTGQKSTVKIKIPISYTKSNDDQTSQDQQQSNIIQQDKQEQILQQKAQFDQYFSKSNNKNSEPSSDLSKIIFKVQNNDNKYIGQITIGFSEELLPLKKDNDEINFDLLSEQGTFLNLTYINKNIGEITMNVLESWQLFEFNQREIKIQLNFSNPLYVSTATDKDQIKFEIIEPKIFRRAQSGHPMTIENAKENTLLIELPQQMKSQEEFQEAQALASSSQNNMGIGLLISMVVYFIFKSVAIDYIWTMYSMIQLLSHQINLHVSIPAQLSLNYDKIMLICNFKIHEIPPFPDLIKSISMYLFEFIDQLGSLILSLIILFLVIILVNLIYLIVLKSKKLSSIVQIIKQKLMWSSVLRSLMQGYFLQTYLAMKEVKNLIDNNQAQLNEIQITKFIITIIISLFFPVGVTLFLKKQNEKLIEDSFIGSYGTLYSNLQIFSNQRMIKLYWVSLYLGKRLLLSVITVWTKYTWLQVSLYVYIHIFTMSHLVQFKPMNSRGLNWMEFLNEFFVLFSCQYLFLFTDLILDLNNRSNYASYLMHFLIVVIAIDCTILIASMIYKFYNMVKLEYIKRKNLQNHEKELTLQESKQQAQIKKLQTLKNKLSNKKSISDQTDQNQNDQNSIMDKEPKLQKTNDNQEKVQKNQRNEPNDNISLVQMTNQIFNLNHKDQTMPEMFKKMRQRLESAGPDENIKAKREMYLFMFSSDQQLIQLAQTQFKTDKELDDFLFCMQRLEIVSTQSLLWKKLNHQKAVLQREQQERLFLQMKQYYVNENNKKKENQDRKKQDENSINDESSQDPDSDVQNLTIVKQQNLKMNPWHKQKLRY